MFNQVMINIHDHNTNLFMTKLMSDYKSYLIEQGNSKFVALTGDQTPTFSIVVEGFQVCTLSEIEDYLDQLTYIFNLVNSSQVGYTSILTVDEVYGAILKVQLLEE